MNRLPHGKLCILFFSLYLTGCDSARSKSGRGIIVSNRESFSKNSGDLGKDDTKQTDENGINELSTHKKGPETLIWKRYRAFEHNLMSGLELKKAEICQELGTKPCVDEIHLAVLGGNEPYINTQYERAKSPTILTSVAVERIVLSACEKRLAIDRSLGAKAIVFRHLQMQSNKISKNKFDAQVVDLYRRLLARNPSEEEKDVLNEHLAADFSVDDLSLGLCFVIGTHAEMIFL